MIYSSRFDTGCSLLAHYLLNKWTWQYMRQFAFQLRGFLWYQTKKNKKQKRILRLDSAGRSVNVCKSAAFVVSSSFYFTSLSVSRSNPVTRPCHDRIMFTVNCNDQRSFAETECFRMWAHSIFFSETAWPDIHIQCSWRLVEWNEPDT